MTLGLILGVIAWKMYKRSLVIPPTGDPATDPKAAAAATAAQASSELSWDELRPIDPLGLEVGYRLIPLVDKNQGGELMARIKGVRRKLTQDIGFLVPPVHIRDNLELSANAYRLLVHGVPVATAEIYPDRELALDPGGALGQLDGIPGKGRRSAWMPPGSSRTSAPMPNRWATPWSTRPPWSPPICRT